MLMLVHKQMITVSSKAASSLGLDLAGTHPIVRGESLWLYLRAMMALPATDQNLTYAV